MMSKERIKAFDYELPDRPVRYHGSLSHEDDGRFSGYFSTSFEGDVYHSSLWDATSEKYGILAILQRFACAIKNVHTDWDDNLIDDSYKVRQKSLEEQMRRLKEEMVDAKIEYYLELLDDNLVTRDFAIRRPEL
jgi:hypothetical protein